MGKIYFISPGSEIIEYMFADLNHNQDVTYVHEPIKHIQGLLKSIFIKYSKINNRISLHINRLWYFLYSLSDLDLKDGDIVILTNGVFNYYDAEYIKYIRNHKKTKFACIFLDPIKRLGLGKDRVLHQIMSSHMDYIGTFDKKDAQEQKWDYVGNIYSKNDQNLEVKPSIDLYFLGANKDNRLDVLNQINKKIFLLKSFLSLQVKELGIHGTSVS